MLELDLPSHIKQLQNEVEQLAGYPLNLLQDKMIAGEMKAENKGGVPTIKYRNNFNIEGIAHELMHLKLEYNGYKPLSFPEGNHLIEQAAVILQNVVQHQMIFPQLETWGYYPRKKECPGTQKMLDVIEKADYSRLKDEPYLSSLFAMVYVRGKLDCNDESLNKNIDRLFSNTLLYKVKQMGNAVVKTIKEFQLNSITDYKTTFNQCLCLLNLSDIVTLNPDDIE